MYFAFKEIKKKILKAFKSRSSFLLELRNRCSIKKPLGQSSKMWIAYWQAALQSWFKDKKHIWEVYWVP